MLHGLGFVYRKISIRDSLYLCLDLLSFFFSFLFFPLSASIVRMLPWMHLVLPIGKDMGGTGEKNRVVILFDDDDARMLVGDCIRFWNTLYFFCLDFPRSSFFLCVRALASVE